ncbi:hypothetical protein [Clostridium ihumii]
MRKRNLKCYTKLTMKDKTEVSVFKINFYDNLLSKLVENNIKT